MSTVVTVIVIAVIAGLIGFIVLQRRRPAEADRIAAALDEAAKKAEQAAVDTFKKATKKGGK